VFHTTFTTAVSPTRTITKAYRSWFREGKEARMWFWPRLGLRIYGATTPITLTSSHCSVYLIRETTLSNLKNNSLCNEMHSKVNSLTFKRNLMLSSSRWKKRQYVATSLHGVTYQKVMIVMFVAERISNISCLNHLHANQLSCTAEIKKKGI
jgi:uncharacterized protein (UPF0210 family)